MVWVAYLALVVACGWCVLWSLATFGVITYFRYATHTHSPPHPLTEAHALLGEDVDAPLTPPTGARIFPLTVPWAWLVLWCGCRQESRGRQLLHRPRCECPSCLSACLFI